MGCGPVFSLGMMGWEERLQIPLAIDRKKCYNNTKYAYPYKEIIHGRET